MITRQERREAARELAKEAVNVISLHEQRLLTVESVLSIITQVLRDDGLITDEKWQAAQKKIIESIG